MFFDHIEAAPADPILGLTEKFQQDQRPGKINLGVGVYKDESGATPILKCVKEAERRIFDEEKSKTYLPITGIPEFGRLTRELLFGKGSPRVADGSAVTCHCPGGTGALRFGADFIIQQGLSKTVWISDPTWINHVQIAKSSGLRFERYPYYDPDTHSIPFDRMMGTLSKAKEGDVVLIHACCHNPTGLDLNPAQWRELSLFLKERHLLPALDFAYQGFGDGLEEDAAGLRAILENNAEALIASSFSKNFGLYCERVGALTVVCADKATAERANSQLKITVRTSISNPPAHGEKIVLTVLSDPELRAQWEGELATMRNRINDMRSQLAARLNDSGVGDFSFMQGQRGMFSFSGLTKDQVAALQRDFGIYIVGSGRICVAGINQGNLDRLVEAMAKVIRG
ncbi:MAG: aspartate/tyrosine/aromatic aminotransferase [Succinivibrionaceae bacterium]|nr:aspartate/tyrosine/aromatic aminotransferase [Succinivibrionaceae bacterium]